MFNSIFIDHVFLFSLSAKIELPDDWQFCIKIRVISSNILGWTWDAFRIDKNSLNNISQLNKLKWQKTNGFIQKWKYYDLRISGLGSPKIWNNPSIISGKYCTISNSGTDVSKDTWKSG
jgi:hypothetical protein